MLADIAFNLGGIYLTLDAKKAQNHIEEALYLYRKNKQSPPEAMLLAYDTVKKVQKNPEAYKALEGSVIYADES